MIINWINTYVWNLCIFINNKWIVKHELTDHFLGVFPFNSWIVSLLKAWFSCLSLSNSSRTYPGTCEPLWLLKWLSTWPLEALKLVFSASNWPICLNSWLFFLIYSFNLLLRSMFYWLTTLSFWLFLGSYSLLAAGLHSNWLVATGKFLD